MRTDKAMGPVAFTLCGIALASLSFGLGVAIGLSITKKQAERETQRLRDRVASMHTDLDSWRRRRWPRR